LHTSELKQRRKRWIYILQEYDFEVIYRAGKKNINADILS